MRVGVITAAQLAAATAIVLWAAGLWAQTGATPASTAPVSPTAEDRKSFAEAENSRYEKTIIALYPDSPVDKGSAEGPDATYYVWYLTSGQANAPRCKGEYEESYASRLRKLGFTKLVSLDEKGGSCELDLITRVVSVPSTFLPPAEEMKQVWKAIQDSPAAKRSKVLARKEYAEFMGRGDKGSSESAEGPDTTHYVFHTSRYAMTEAICISIFTDSVIAHIRELGFTEVICTDKKNASFSFDPAAPVVRQNLVVAQAPSAPAAEPAKPTLPPGTEWTEGTALGHFGPTVAQKVGARSGPAKVTREGESALTSKSYVQIGTIRAFEPGKKGNAEVMQELEAAILKKAAESGGDVVRFSSEGALEILDVPTGKTKTKKECAETGLVKTPVKTTKSCIATSAGPQCSYGTEGGGSVEGCVRFEKREIPITRKEQNLVSEGTVWRNDPKLAADIARAAEAARAAEETRAEATRIKMASAGLPTLGVDVNSPGMRAWLSILDTPEISKFPSTYFYSFKPEGILLGFTKQDKLEVIFLYSEGEQDYRQYQGELPYGLSFRNSRREVESILGSPDDSGAGNEYNYAWTEYSSKGIRIHYNTKRSDDLDARVQTVRISAVP